MLEIKTNQMFDLEETVSKLTAILYDQPELPAVEEFVGQPVLMEDRLLLYRRYCRRQDSGSSQFYLILQLCQSNDLSEMATIERVIGLCDDIVCLELNKEKQVFLEKKVMEILNICEVAKREDRGNYCKKHGRYSLDTENGGSSSVDKQITLHEVSSSYKKSYARKQDNIYYWTKLSEINELFGCNPPVKLGESKFDPSTKHLENQVRQCQQCHLLPKLTLNECIHIFNICQKEQKPTFNTRLTLCKYKQLTNCEQRFNEAISRVFENITDDASEWKTRQMLEKIPLKHASRHELQWKDKQLKRFRSLMAEHKQLQDSVRKYKASRIYELPPSVIILQINQFYRNWLRSTCSELKTQFNLIANRRDAKAIDQFTQLSLKSQRRIAQCLQQSSIEMQTHRLLKAMENELNRFIEYHHNIIQTTSLSSGLRFYRNQLRFLWKNQQKIFQKIGLLLMIILLGYMQQNIIIGITIIGLGIIFSAANI